MPINITIITPVKDDRKIFDLADSIFCQQHFKEYEWIISANGATDDFVNEIKEYVKGRKNCHILEQKEKSIPGALNSAIDKSIYKYLWFIDSDCVLSSDCINSPRNQLTESNLIYTGLIIFKGRGKFAELTAKLRNYVSIPSRGNFYICNTIINKSIFERFGKFNKTLRYGFDSEFSGRVVKAGFEPKKIPDLTVYHYCHTRPKEEVRIWYQYGRGRAFRFRNGYFGPTTFKNSIICLSTPKLIYPGNSPTYIIFAFSYYIVRGLGFIVSLLTNKFS